MNIALATSFFFPPSLKTPFAPIISLSNRKPKNRVDRGCNRCDSSSLPLENNLLSLSTKRIVEESASINRRKVAGIRSDGELHIRRETIVHCCNKRLQIRSVVRSVSSLIEAGIYFSFVWHMFETRYKIVSLSTQEHAPFEYRCETFVLRRRNGIE